MAKIYSAIALLVVLGAGLIGSRWLRERDLESAQRLAVAQAAADSALQRSIRADAAREAQAGEIARLRADGERVRVIYRSTVDTVQATAPDTCAPYISALVASFDSVRVVDSLTIEQMSNRIQTDSLDIASMRGALAELHKVPGRPADRSLLASLIPKLDVGVGPFVGVDFNGRTTAGVGLGIVVHF